MEGYHSDTMLVTDEGVKSFRQLCEGQSVNVLCADGVWRRGIARKSETKEKLYHYSFRSLSAIRTIACTKGLRWPLQTGTPRTIIENDCIMDFQKVKYDYPFIPRQWIFGYILGAGIEIRAFDEGTGYIKVTSGSTKINLTKSRMKYKQIFLDDGWVVDGEDNDELVTLMKKREKCAKDRLIEVSFWEYMSHEDICNIFDGFIAACGKQVSNGAIIISTHNKRFRSFIESISAILGYHVWTSRESTNITAKDNVIKTYDYYLTPEQPLKWTLDTVRVMTGGTQQVWTIDEPETKTFMLYGGIVVPASTFDY